MSWLKLGNGVSLNLSAAYLIQEWADGSFTAVITPTDQRGPGLVADIEPADRERLEYALGMDGLTGTYSGPPPRRPTQEELQRMQQEQLAAASRQIFVPPGGIANGHAVSSFDRNRKKR